MSDNNFEAEATGGGLVRFLDYAIDKGHLKTSTGQAMKTAVKEVLSSTEGNTEWESVELDKLDVDDIQRRFETLRAMKFSSGSLSTYKSRFRKALGMFNDFRESPSNWRPSIKTRDRKPKEHAVSTSTGGTMTSSRDLKQAPQKAPSPTPLAAPHRSTIITYPFPIREGVLASIDLPADLTAREAERVAAFIASLAVEVPHKPTADED